MEGSASPIRVRVPKIRGERAEWLLGALSLAVLAVIAALCVFVFTHAWPSFAHNGFDWFTSGGNVNLQLRTIFSSTGSGNVYYLRAWPLIFGTLLSTGLAVLCGLVLALLGAMFMVEFAPPLLRRMLRPSVRLLAGVPSVIYGLVGLLALAPLIQKYLVSKSFALAVAPIVQISGTGLLLAVIVLTIMVTPIMLSIIADALESVPRTWVEGSAALGVNRWRTMWRISVTDDPPGDHGRPRAGHGACARRGDRPVDDRRRVRLLAQPAGRLELLSRADLAARGRDRGQLR